MDNNPTRPNDLLALQAKVRELEETLEEEINQRELTNVLLEQHKTKLKNMETKISYQQEVTRQKDHQLEFITALAASTLNEPSIAKVINKFIDQATAFLQTPLSLYANRQKSEQGYQLNAVKGCNSELITEAKQQNPITELNFDALINALAEIEYESQLVVLNEFMPPPALEELQSSFMFVLPVKHGTNKFGFAFFFFHSDDDIDISKLQTLESARSVVNIAIQQKTSAVTLRKRFEELQSTHQQLEQTQSQLIQSEKMVSLGQLAAGVAHEINNPVGYVLSNFAMLDEYIVDIKNLLSELEELANKVGIQSDQWYEMKSKYDVEFLIDDLESLVVSSKDGLKRVKNIVGGLKTFSHGDTTTLEPVTMKTLLEQVLELTMNQLKYDYKVVTDFQDSHFVMANAGQLEQVFINFIVNARQAMEPGGTLSIYSRDDEHSVYVTIKDTGCGISEENISKLFTPFFTTKPVGVGTGLGLSISYAIIEGHHGTIEVDSKLGVGTSFTMKFPVHRD